MLFQRQPYKRMPILTDHTPSCLNDQALIHFWGLLDEQTGSLRILVLPYLKMMRPLNLVNLV